MRSDPIAPLPCEQGRQRRSQPYEYVPQDLDASGDLQNHGTDLFRGDAPPGRRCERPTLARHLPVHREGSTPLLEVDDDAMCTSREIDRRVLCLDSVASAIVDDDRSVDRE